MAHDWLIIPLPEVGKLRGGSTPSHPAQAARAMRDFVEMKAPGFKEVGAHNSAKVVATASAIWSGKSLESRLERTVPRPSPWGGGRS